MNFWKQTTHVMSYFPEENFRGHERLPKTFMQGFLEVSPFATPLHSSTCSAAYGFLITAFSHRAVTRKEMGINSLPLYIAKEQERISDSLLEQACLWCPERQCMYAIGALSGCGRHAIFLNPTLLLSVPGSRPPHAFWAMNSSRATVNLSVTTSQRSSRSARPFSRAAVAVVVSAGQS